MKCITSCRRKAEEEERQRIERERQEAKERIKRVYEEYFQRLQQLRSTFQALERHQSDLQTVLDERTKLAQVRVIFSTIIENLTIYMQFTI
jgi:uncharacterized protein